MYLNKISLARNLQRTMKNYLSFVRILICFFAALSTPTYSNGLPMQTKTDAAIFVIGDSLYDPGNNNFLNTSVKANLPPYGETFFKYPTGRWSDGRVIPDFVVTYLNRSLWRPYLEPGRKDLRYGANFAGAAACALDETIANTLFLRRQVIFLKEVVTLLKQELGNAEADKLMTEAIYLISIGGVDYNVYVSTPSEYEAYDKDYFVNMVIGNLTDAIKYIYHEIGGRKFAFQNVAPLGCLPASKQSYNLSANECQEDLQELARMHNIALSNVTKELETQLPGFKYLIYDFYTTLSERINNPSNYGFKVVDVACCGTGTNRGSSCGSGEYELCNNPYDYLFWDGFHPTEHGYYQLFDLLWTGKFNTTWPVSFEQLILLQPSMSLKSVSLQDGSLLDE